MAVVAGTPRLLALAAGLKEARQASGLSTRDVAKRLGWSQQLVSHFELARRKPSVAQVAMMTVALGLRREERERLVGLAERLDEPNWLTTGAPGVSQQLAGAMESERAARKIVQWSPLLVPGLLQTEEYAQVVVSQNGRAPEDGQPRLVIRMGRQQVILRDEEPVGLVAVIGEAALRDPVVCPKHMVQQLRHLVKVGGRATVEIRVMPAGIGWHPGLAGPFVFYEFPNSGPVVYFEHQSSGAFVPDEDDVAAYRKVIEWLLEISLSPEESMSFIGEIAEEWAAKT